MRVKVLKNISREDFVSSFGKEIHQGKSQSLF